MRHRQFVVRDTKRGHVRKLDFDERHFVRMGIVITPAFGMPASEALAWVNLMNRENNGRGYVYWLEDPEL